MTKSYKFLPFQFQLKGDRALLSNSVGDFCFIKNDVFQRFVNGNLDITSEEYNNLKSKFIVYNDNLASTIDLLATRYRTKKRFLYDFTSLHMFVVTQRCNQKCIYCHASSVDKNGGLQFDMKPETARKFVDLAFISPSPYIKIEFQGGEPLLNFKIIKEIVEYAKELNEVSKKILDFVICTNLTIINDKQIDFILENDIYISTSLDGPADIHNQCRRTRQGQGTYDTVINNMSQMINAIGRDKVSALMTVTSYNIYRLNEVIDEYIKQGLSSIFLRMINPYGYASNSWTELGYSVEEFVKAYKSALGYIISLNLAGQYFPEEFTTLLLTRILTPFSTGFVDLQSPSGAGIGGAIYEINGDVFVADEGRMLAKMNDDKTFCLGNVYNDTWSSMFCGERLRKIVKSSCIEALPGCAWCVYQPYCGCDPVRNYIQFHDFSGNNAKSDFCIKHKKIFDILFDYLALDSDEIEDVFWSWVTCRNLSEVKV